MAYLIVQIVPGLHPRDENVPKDVFTGSGVFVPVSCDGYYSDEADAHDVARFLAEEHPNLQTVLAKVVTANDPHDESQAQPHPDLPRHPGEAPPAFIDPQLERGKMTPALRYEIIRRDGYRCRACGFAVQDGARLHVDHIHPVSKRGKTERENLQTLCAACNLGKGAS